MPTVWHTAAVRRATAVERPVGWARHALVVLQRWAAELRARRRSASRCGLRRESLALDREASYPVPPRTAATEITVASTTEYYPPVVIAMPGKYIIR